MKIIHHPDTMRPHIADFYIPSNRREIDHFLRQRGMKTSNMSASQVKRLYIKVRIEGDNREI